ncbi:MAG: glycerol-3-phosphate acyltransferase [Culicoidibacterales bacterium]
MGERLLWLVFAYVVGSILFAKVAMHVFQHEVVKQAADHNPGTVNAFRYGGIEMGIFTLVGDLLKGFVPVFLYVTIASYPLDFWVGFMMLSPVLGHVFPIFTKFQGGKGVAVTFGAVLGLLPYWQPIGLLVLSFVIVRFIIDIQPDYALTISAYCLTIVLYWLLLPLPYALGFTGIMIVVIQRLLVSDEPRLKVEVRRWKH